MINAILAKIYRKITGNQGIMKDPYDERNFVHLGYKGQEKKELFKDEPADIYFTEKDTQNKHGETMRCVTESAINIIECQINKMIEFEKQGKADDEMKEMLQVLRYFKIIKNGVARVSKRYTAKMSGTSWKGNNYTRVWDSIAHDGILAEDEWPDVKGWNNHYAPIPQEKIDLARKVCGKVNGEQTGFLKIVYERVEPKYFTDAVRYTGSVQCAINAPGRRNANDIRFPTGRNNHAICWLREKIASFVYRDSYMPFFKEYTISHDTGMGVIGHFEVEKKFSPFDQKAIDKLRAKGTKYILRVNKDGEMWELKDNGMEYVGLLEFKDDAVRALAKAGELTGISEKDFRNLYI